MYVNTPPPIASTMYSIFFFSAMSRIPHITQIDSKFIFTSTVPQANSISLCTISCLISFGKQSSPWTVTTTLLPNIFGSHVKKTGPSASGTQQQFYEAGDKLMDSHCFLLFFAISSKLLKKLCQFCAAGAKSSAF